MHRITNKTTYHVIMLWTYKQNYKLLYLRLCMVCGDGDFMSSTKYNFDKGNDLTKDFETKLSCSVHVNSF